MAVLNNIPYNTKKVYIMATTYNGCEVYVPVDSNDEAVLASHKRALQSILDHQSEVCNAPA